MFCATCGHRYDDHPFRHIFKGQVPPGEFVHGSKSRVTAENDKDAEIARLRAELDAVTKQRDAETKRPLRTSVIDPSDYTEQENNVHAEFARLREELNDARSDLAAARAALAKEREACDEARGLFAAPNPFDAKWNEAMRAWCDRYSARRAAEAKGAQ